LNYTRNFQPVDLQQVSNLTDRFNWIFLDFAPLQLSRIAHIKPLTLAALA